MSERRVDQLIFLGEYRQALVQLAAQTEHTALDRALRAWAELELGESERVSEAATTIASQTRDVRTRAFALMVCGKAIGRSGSPEQAIVLTRKAIELIGSIDHSLEAEFVAQHVNALFWIGIEPAVAELPRLRHLALRTGNRNALIEYHLARARAAAFRNVHFIAKSETSTAKRLLENHPNLDQLWRLRELQANLALMDSDLAAAREYSTECLRMASEMGVRFRLAYTRANLAYINAYTGNFDEAKALIHECNLGLPPFSRARLATLSTGIHIGITTRDDAFAKKMIDEGLRILTEVGDEQTYYRLWFELQHARWLLSVGQAVEALQRAETAAVAVPRLADLHLLTWFQLTEVEALYELGRIPEAQQRFSGACGSLRNPSLEVLADVMRVAGVLSSRSSATDAKEYFTDSERLLSIAGMDGVRADLERTRDRILGQDSRSHQDHPDRSVVKFGLLLRLGRHPFVFGFELLSLIPSETELQLQLIKRKENDERVVYSRHPRPVQLSDDSVSVMLGEDGTTSYWLRGKKPVTVSGALLWHSVVQIVTATLATEGRTRNTDFQLESSFDDTPTQQLGIVASAEGSLELLNTTRKLAPSNITVLITGETGTGKELYARALHDASPRSAKPFIPFNCSAVSREMLDAQLFGYRKGAFTGAADAFAGVIRAATGGTLFLDEIGEVALDVQPKLLRFLESGEIHPLGESRPLAVDVRVVAATNANLEHMVDEGRFREDLFYRLNVVRLHVPPLRERREEIPPLVQHFLDKYSRDGHKAGLRVADETMEYLILYKWPGNVRQLANEIRRMVALAESNAVLMPEHLSPDLAASRRTIPASERTLAATEVVVRMDQPMSAAMEHLERSMIQYALALSSGRVEDAAVRLGLSRKGLYLKRQRLAMHDADIHEPSTVSA